MSQIRRADSPPLAERESIPGGRVPPSVGATGWSPSLGGGVAQTEACRRVDRTEWVGGPSPPSSFPTPTGLQVRLGVNPSPGGGSPSSRMGDRLVAFPGDAGPLCQSVTSVPKSVTSAPCIFPPLPISSPMSTASNLIHPYAGKSF